jgi:hypothetical protein
MQDTEIWKDIPGYENLYQVSNLGRVRKLPLNRFNVVKKLTIMNGYFTTRLTKVRRQRKTSFVHRLVAEAFIPNPENKPFINHINECRRDNRVENLEWCTQGENNIHSLRVNNARRKYTVVSIDTEKIKKIIHLYYTHKFPISKISRFMGIRSSTIKLLVESKKWRFLRDRKYYLEIVRSSIE